MQAYELSYLVLPSIAEEAVGSVADKIKGLIAEAGGQELISEAPFLMGLAYPMTKVVGASRYVVDEAYLGWVKFDLPQEAEDSDAEHPVQKLRREVEGMDEVLRSLLIKAPRETLFTFAKAREAKAAALAEKAAKEQEASEADSESKEPVIE